MNTVLEAREPSARYLTELEPQLLSEFDLIAQAPNGVARLRELILSLAVQGKLVPQDASDEPASVLLERIRGEKARLVKEGKIRKDKPLAKLSEEEKLFSLPHGWAEVSLASLGGFSGGKTPSTHRPEYWEGTIPWVTSKDMKSLWISDTQDHVTQQALADGLSLIPSGVVLIVVRSGILRRTVPVAITSVPCTVNQDLKALQLVIPCMAQYVQLMIRGFERFILENLTKVGTTVESIRFEDFERYQFPLPPLAEQSRIVARVEELMALCDALETKDKLETEQHARLVGSLFESLANSESAHALAENWQRIAAHFDLLLDRPAAVDALEQTILQLAVRGLLVPQDPADQPASALLQTIRHEKARLIAAGKIKRDKPLSPISDEDKPYELPGGWEWVRLGTVADVASNLVSPEPYQDMLQVAPDCIEKATGHLLERRTVKDAGVTSPNHRFYAGQILYSKIRPSLSKAVVVDFEGLCSADMYPLNSWLDTGYMHRYILSQPFLDQVRTAENRVKMPKLNQEALNSFLVPVPPLPEQSRIVARIAELRELCTKLRQRLTFAQQTQSRLAYALVASVAI